MATVSARGNGLLLGVVVEALATLASELSGTNHLAEQGVWTILGIGVLVVEHLHDG